MSFVRAVLLAGRLRTQYELNRVSHEDLVGLALGVDAGAFFGPLAPPVQPVPPQRLQFRLRAFVQYQSTDDTFRGARDEVWISAIGVDSSTAHFGANGQFVLDEINAPVSGDVSDDRPGPRIPSCFSSSISNARARSRAVVS